MKLIRLKGVATKLGVSTVTVWRMEKNDPSFPRAFRIGQKTKAWDEAELDAWAETKRVSAA